MVIERVEPLGFDLFELVKLYRNAMNRFMPMAQWNRYLDQLLDAVQHLHDNGWVHCDLKLDNVLIASDHQVKLIDFGMVRKAGKDKPPLRTPYMPPEFDNRDQAIETSADFWMLGAMMLMTFTAYPVKHVWFTKDEVKQHGILHAMKSVWRWPISVTDEVQEAINNLLQVEADKRWTCEELRSWIRSMENAQAPTPKSDEELDHGNLVETGKGGAKSFRKANLEADRIIKAF